MPLPLLLLFAALLLPLPAAAETCDTGFETCEEEPPQEDCEDEECWQEGSLSGGSSCDEGSGEWAALVLLPFLLGRRRR